MMRDGIQNMEPLSKKLPWFLSGRLILIDTPSPHQRIGNSSVNKMHLNVTLALYWVLKNIYDLRDVQALSLYEAHTSELSVALIPSFPEVPTPLSVIQAQGNEFPVVILNMVKAGQGFPTNPQVINVAVSRAQTQLFIIADSKALLDSPMWSDIRKIWFDPNNEMKKNVKADRIITAGIACSRRWNKLMNNQEFSS